MPNNYIILPMFAMVLISFTTLVLLFRARIMAVKQGDVSAGFFKTYQGQTEPEINLKLSRHFINLFESPVLFYVVCISALASQHASTVFQLVAWGYVLIRVLHAIAHIGPNKLIYRIAIYFGSWVLLLVLWGLLSFKVVVGS